MVREVESWPQTAPAIGALEDAALILAGKAGTVVPPSGSYA